MTRRHNLFVLGSEFFAFLGSGLLAFGLSFELGLFAILRHWP
jgi:Sec-independent protein secretion pathway component TatC